MITASLTNTLGTVQLPPIEGSLDTETLENARDVTLLSFDVYTDFINSKRQWPFKWDSLDEATFNAIRAIYNSQFTLHQYPTLSIPYYSVSDVPVRMYMGTKHVWDHCGSVENVEVMFRETSQIPVFEES